MDRHCFLFGDECVGTIPACASFRSKVIDSAWIVNKVNKITTNHPDFYHVIGHLNIFDFNLKFKL